MEGKSLQEVTAMIQELIVDPKSNIGMNPEEKEGVIAKAKAGLTDYKERTVKMVEQLLENYELTVAEMTAYEAARQIYNYLWGLDILECIYSEPKLDELRVNDPEHIYVQKRGLAKKVELQLRDNEHVGKLITRMLEHDRTSLDESNPGCESSRLDGSRLTALGPPVTKGPCFVIRKHGTFDISDENYISSGTMDGYTQKILSTLVRGRANILICGDTNVGKTTLLRWLTKFLHERLRLVTMETDKELFLDEWYPERDILALEAHPEVGWDMRRLFIAALRLSPDVIIVGEARGLGEAGQMINAIRSGHHGSMGTIHVYNAYEAVSVLAQMALEEGRRLPVNLLEGQIATAFNVIIQMYGNSVTGTKKIERIIEVWKGRDGPEYRDLCVWKPSVENYEKGEWVYPNRPSEKLLDKLFRFGVGKDELAYLERVRAS